MDDDIEIEEHDILEHPLVKAVFPDLSKIEIQVHTGAYDASLLHTEESSLLEDIPNYIESNFSEDIYDGVEIGGENHLQDIFDEELNNVPQEDTLQEGDIDKSRKLLPDNISKTLNRHVDIVHEISDDEPEVPENIKNIANENQTIVKDFKVDFKSQNTEETFNCVEISDDEEKNINGLNSENCVASDVDIDETQENKDNHTVDDKNSDIENSCYANDIAMLDDQSCKYREDIVDGHDKHDDLLDENQNSPTENIQESEKSSLEDEYITGDLIDEVENRHLIQTENSDSFVKDQTDDDMYTKISEETYTEVSIKQEIEDVPFQDELLNDFDTEEYNFDDSASAVGANLNVTPSFSETTDYIPNKIILGSKPSPTCIPHDKNFSYLVVCLEDWGTHLNQSLCYCHECKILFTTPNALDYHNMSAHSLLAPIINRAVKSTAKSSKPNIAKKSTSARDLDKSHCSHCNVDFKDNTALIKHLYELLPQQYKCNLCSKTFNSQNDLANHNAVHVKLEHRKILKPKKNLDNPMLRNLLTQKSNLPIKAKSIPPKVIKVPVKIKTEPVDDSGLRFKCMVCGDILSTYRLARKHKKSHPEKKNKMVFKKIIIVNKLKRSRDKLVFEDEKPRKKYKISIDPVSSKSDNSDIPQIVPKSALFQCPKCYLHFTSTSAVIAHMGRIKCDPKSNFRKWSCPTCKKKLRIQDKEIHKKQHQLSTKLKIYKLTKNTYERTLCKCLNCNVHFDYTALKMHLKNCGKIPTAKCQKCNILVVKNKLLGHMKKHEILKLKPKDFMFVEYLIENNNTKKMKKQEKYSAKSTVTRSIADITKPYIIKIKPGVELKQTFLKVDQSRKSKRKKLIMYYCNHCKISLTSIRKPESHYAKKCVMYGKQAYVCNKCGLFLPWKTKYAHYRLHQQKQISLNDIQFFDLVTRKPIPVPVIKYTSCPTCKIHFLTKSHRRKHICGEDYENCEYCGDMFEISTLQIHRQFHQAGPKTEKTKPEESSEYVIPELMMRYESLNPIWNILFICSKCELVTDLYNKAVEHSQEHLKKGYKQPKSVTCHVCNLLFDETSWAKHKELHTQRSINREAFNILTYTPENLLEESWFKMFESVPEKEIRQIIDQSVFGGERSLKMKLMKYGLPEFTLYCCSNCQVCYDTNNLTAHVNAKCKGSKYRCTECEIAFENESTLTFHKMLHERGIRREEFRIIHFIKTTQTVKLNSYKDRAGSSKMKEKELEPFKINEKVDPRALKILMEVRERVRNGDIDFDNPIEYHPRAKFCLQRCINCSACIRLRKHRIQHKCAPIHKLFYCPICKQNFHMKRKGCHNLEHDSNPNFKPKNTEVFEFDSNDINKINLREPDTKAKKKYKNLKVISSKVKINKKVFATSKPSKMKRANSVESFQNIVKIITNDNTVDTNQEFNSTLESNSNQGNRKSFKIYKCDCGLHYTSLKTIEKHMETCNSGVEISTDNCSKCGLLFPTDILVTHLCKHHSLANIDPYITIEEVKKNKSNYCETNIGAKNEKTGRETNSTEVITEKHNSSGSESSTKEVNYEKKSTDCIKLYKCGGCQVHYLNQNTCYKHAYKNHVKLDPRKFIDCKVCGLTFTLGSLQMHITRHHKTDLDLDKVLVEEYLPSEVSYGKKAMKIDIYFASERVQNLQVSSSND